jgi:hypothetical protein
VNQIVQEGHPRLTPGALCGLAKVLSGSPPGLIKADGLLLLRGDGHGLFLQAKDGRYLNKVKRANLYSVYSNGIVARCLGIFLQGCPCC